MGIFVRFDKQGRKVYWIDYYVESRRRREKVGYRLRDAKDALASRETDARRKKFDGIIPEPDVTLLELQGDYLKFSKTTKAETTAAREKLIFETLISYFGATPINRITAADVESFRAGRRAEKKAAATINKEVQTLKHIARTALSWGRIRQYHFAAVRPLKIPPGKAAYLEREDFHRLLKACPEWLRPIVILAANTGLRRSEILGLQRKDIDRRHFQLIIDQRKNNEPLAVPMNRTVRDLLERLPVRIGTPFLFADEEGRPLSGGRVSVTFKRAARKAGLRGFRLHDLRHHFASWLTMNGKGLRVVQELLGHKDPRMTARYAHLSSDYLRSAVESLDEFPHSRSSDRLVPQKGS